MSYYRYLRSTKASAGFPRCRPRNARPNFLRPLRAGADPHRGERSYAFGRVLLKGSPSWSGAQAGESTTIAQLAVPPHFLFLEFRRIRKKRSISTATARAARDRRFFLAIYDTMHRLCGPRWPAVPGPGPASRWSPCCSHPWPENASVLPAEPAREMIHQPRFPSASLAR